MRKPEVPDSLLQHDDYLQDAEVQILAEAVSQLKIQSLDKLATGHNFTTIHERPFTEVTGPIFLYVDINVLPSGEASLGMWCAYDDIDGPTPPSAGKLSAAVHRVGFRRSESKDPYSVMTMHSRDQNVIAAPILALEGTMDELYKAGEIEGTVWTLPNLVAVELSNATASFWIESTEGNGFGWYTWLVRHDEVSPIEVTEDELIRVIAENLKVATTSRSGVKGEKVLLTLTGDGWTEANTRSLLAAVPTSPKFEVVGCVDPMFAASLGAAKWARIQTDPRGSCVSSQGEI